MTSHHPPRGARYNLACGQAVEVMSAMVQLGDKQRQRHDHHDQQERGQHHSQPQRPMRTDPVLALAAIVPWLARVTIRPRWWNGKRLVLVRAVHPSLAHPPSLPCLCVSEFQTNDV